MDTNKVKKVSIVYLLAAIFLPIALIILGGVLAGTVFIDDSTLFMVLSCGPLLLSALWWVVGLNALWKQRKQAVLDQLPSLGFRGCQVFHGSSQLVVVDVQQGKVALLFFWNPFQPFVMSAGRITKAWTDDGAFGAGFMRGTSRVSFLFLVDDIRVRVNTFTSNQRWKMDDPRILEGVSKADMMVQVLAQAKQASGG